MHSYAFAPRDLRTSRRLAREWHIEDRPSLWRCFSMLTHSHVRFVFKAAWCVLVGAAAACGPQDDRYPDVNAFCYGRARAECSSEVVKACAAPNADHCVEKR